MKLEIFQKPWDFELLDTSHGMRLERWGQVVLSRPDPQIIWPKSLAQKEWDKAWATYKSAVNETRGQWEIKKNLPNPWVIKWQDLSFLLKLSPFKHTGIFAEQATNWEWMVNTLEGKTQKGFSLPMLPAVAASQSNESSSRNKSVSQTKAKILNLFAYTGGATMVLAKMGCHITHVDASKPSLNWANENHKLNNLPKDSVRWILDDCVKFVKREIKRGAKYDGIIMDPPAYGHSPTGKTWKFNEDLHGLLSDCVKLLSADAKFLVINAYATNSSALALNNLLTDATKKLPGKIEFGELCLKQKTNRMISTGIFARWYLT